MSTQSIEGAMPPLPEPDHKFVDMEDEDPDILVWRAEKMHAYAKAYAAPLLARVAELEKQNRDIADLIIRQDREGVVAYAKGLIYKETGGVGRVEVMDDDMKAALAAHKEQP